uniref:Uncharacterized protein n=1 Tax=Arundo donax TaxID=35708 RepID=A0A0A9C8A9_ARUDO
MKHFVEQLVGGADRAQRRWGIDGGPALSQRISASAAY